MRIAGILIGLWCLCLPQLSGQKFPEKGVPPLQNYTPEEYAQAGKVWAIQSAENGLVYFATEQGLLEYDGLSWRKFTGSRGVTRSLLVVNDSLIYTGADKDFGLWKRKGNLGFQYTSAYPFQHSTKGLNEEFWAVYQMEEGIVFTSFDNLYLKQEDHLTRFPAPTRFSKSFQLGASVFLADEAKGLYEFNGESISQVFAFPPASSWNITGLTTTDEGLMIITQENGVYTWTNGRLKRADFAVNTSLMSNKVFSFIELEDQHFAFGTILDGVYITDRNGAVIQHLSKEIGILNNTVLSMHYSSQGNLWLGLDFGISQLKLSSDIAYILDHKGTFGTGQTAFLQGKTFYLGTNQGLYHAPWSELRNDAEGISFTLVPGSAGQAWALEQIGDDLLCGHDNGLFKVSMMGLTPVDRSEGILSMTELGKQHLVAGTYNGLRLFQKKNQSWKPVQKIPPVQGACNQVLADGDSLLWINIPNFGILKASLSPEFQIQSQRIFLAEDFDGEHLWLSKDSSQIRIRSSLKSYAYDRGIDRFMVVEEAKPITPVVNRLPIWWSGLSLTSMYQFYPVQNGFALQHRSPKIQKGHLPTVLIRSLAAFNNDTFILMEDPIQIPNSLNNVRIEYLLPNQSQVQYRYRLKNFQDDWSEWSVSNSRDFLDLPHGRYDFVVESKSSNGIIQTASASLTVLAPWYRSWYAYLAVGIFLFGIYSLQRRRHLRKLRRLESKLEAQEVQVREKQAVVYEHQKNLQIQQRMQAELHDLKKRLRIKTIELAKKGKENEDKNRLLQQLKSKLAAIEDKSSEPNIRWTEMSRLLEKKTSLEDHTFELQIDELNQEFLRKLKTEYPSLTTYDLRLATYLRMGLSSREIAELLNVLPSSVNVSRSRLRKKLNLTITQDLYEFLMEV